MSDTKELSEDILQKFINTKYRFNNQKDIDILAEYLGNSASKFVFLKEKTKAIPRALFSILEGNGLKNLSKKDTYGHLYLDLLLDDQLVRLTLQVNSESIILGSWNLADPNGVEEVRKRAETLLHYLEEAKQ